MGLTNEERRRWDELAEDLSRQDPQLGRILGGHALRWKPSLRLQPVLLCALVICAAVLFVLGVAFGQLWVFTVGSVVLVVAGWLGGAAGRRSLQRRLDQH